MRCNSDRRHQRARSGLFTTAPRPVVGRARFASSGVRVAKKPTDDGGIPLLRDAVQGIIHNAYSFRRLPFPPLLRNSRNAVFLNLLCCYSARQAHGQRSRHRIGDASQNRSNHQGRARAITRSASAVTMVSRRASNIPAYPARFRPSVIQRRGCYLPHSRPLRRWFSQRTRPPCLPPGPAWDPESRRSG